MERNILLTIEYDGTNFSGWQRQPAVRTVQGELEKALSKACACAIKLNGTSRTDAGVHALGQRASFSGDFGIPTDRIKLTVNNILAGMQGESQKPADVRIVDVREMAPEFHARFDSKGKKYRYVIANCEELPVFQRNYCYQVKRPLDVKLMQTAAALIEGKRDFACFQAAGGNERETTVRTIHRLEVLEKDGNINVEVSGDGFLYNMVRIIVGTLVEVGMHKKSCQDVAEILESCDRQRAGHTAPPQGLYLVEVYY